MQHVDPPIVAIGVRRRRRWRRRAASTAQADLLNFPSRGVAHGVIAPQIGSQDQPLSLGSSRRAGPTIGHYGKTGNVYCAPGPIRDYLSSADVMGGLRWGSVPGHRGRRQVQSFRGDFVSHDNALEGAHAAHWLFLDCARFGAAVLVLFGHSRGLLFESIANVEAPSALTRAAYLVTGLQHEAVVIFFVISGFLVGGAALKRIEDGQFRVALYLF